jgi:type IX secretion system PorP/SprF family membrane protein
MKATALLTTIAMAVSATVSAQQDPLSTQFWNTLLHINPATAGLEYRHEAHLQYRNQWNRVSGAPSAGYANYSAKIDRIHGAAGVSYQFDMAGYSHTHTALGHYAFHIPIKNSVLSIGIAGGTQTYALDWERLTFSDSSNDPLVPRGGQRTAFTMNTGVAFHAPKWNAGFGVTHLNAPAFDMESIFGAGTTSYNAARNYYLTGDYTFTLSDNWSLRPRVLAATDAVKAYAQLSVVAGFKNAWLSVNCRTTESFGGAAGYDFRGKWRVGYAYEVWNSRLSNGILLGTHELTLGLLLK